ncbi:MAG: anthranilate synthase component I family protein, partial [Cyclobacteriaceae bacterium]|nr:anthranilate synthase component I family protein [Cyclobacteriaceae bacterium]
MNHVKFPILTTYKKRLADTITPVSIYLQIRDRFANPILLESSDYHGQENSYSYICFNPLATFSFNDGKVSEKLPNGEELNYEVTPKKPLMDHLRAFGNKFDPTPDKFKFSTNGLFGYIQYDTVGWFEDIKL